MVARKSNQESSVTEVPVGPNREMGKTKRVYHDLFILKTAKLLQDISMNVAIQVPYGVDHQHRFHSVDSSGRVQKFASSVGGHTHEVTITTDENNNLVGVCSPPFNGIKGKKFDLKPFKTDKGPVLDTHIHEVEYINSKEIDVRIRSEEAAKFLAGVQ